MENFFMFKKIVFWSGVLISFIWLKYIWSSSVDSITERWIFILAVTIFTPIWIGFIWLINSQRFPGLIRVVEVAIAIPWIIYFLYSALFSRLEIFEMFLYSAYYGIFWMLGPSIKKWGIRPFQE